ncbi:tripartite tricarboxylate transporter permease [Archaeoglobus sp.]
MIEAVLFGVLLGILTGLTPGIHSNTSAMLIISTASLLSKYFSREELAIVIFVNAIVHTFLDVIPTVFLGVPDEDTAVGILPMHELVLDGKGISACVNSAFSSLGGFLLSLPIFAIYLHIRLNLSSVVPLVLIAVSAYLIASEREFLESRLKKSLQALTVFLLSGTLGYVCFGNSSLLLPLLTGLFASPILLTSMFSDGNIGKQELSFHNPSFKDIVSGVLAGSFVSLFPSVSSGVATLISSNHLRDNQRMVSAISSANTSNAILCFAIFFSSGKVRSGAVSAFKELFPSLSPLKLIYVGLIASLTATILTIAFAIAFGKFAEKVRPSKLSTIVFLFNVFVIYILTKGFGLMVFAIATLIGFLSVILKVRRENCMGSLMLPTILVYLL